MRRVPVSRCARGGYARSGGHAPFYHRSLRFVKGGRSGSYSVIIYIKKIYILIRNTIEYMKNTPRDTLTGVASTRRG